MKRWRQRTSSDPEIPIAEAKGLRKLAQSEFVITFWVSPTIAHDTLSKFFRALRLAEEPLEQNADRYLHLWERNIPPAFEGDHDYASFGRGEKLIFEPYSLEMFEDAMQFARTWGLHEHKGATIAQAFTYLRFRTISRITTLPTTSSAS
jgi:hypothetical protein